MDETASARRRAILSVISDKRRSISRDDFADLLKGLVDLDSRFEGGRGVGETTLLTFAAEFAISHMPALELLKAGAGVNAALSNGATPLMKAVLGRRPHVAQELIMAGAHLDAVDSAGNSALHFAASDAGVDMVDILLRNWANPNARDGVGVTPSMVAVISQNRHSRKSETLEAFRLGGADFSLVDDEGRSVTSISEEIGFNLPGFVKSSIEESLLKTVVEEVAGRMVIGVRSGI